MAYNSVVEPKQSPAAPVVEPTQPPPPAQEAPPAAQAAPGEAGATAGIPDEVLQLPAMQGLFAGSPPALSAPLAEFAKRPEGQLIQKAAPTLQKAGMGLYRSIGGDLGVMFNQFYISGEEIKAADEAGKLAEIAPPFDEVSQQIAGMGLDAHPATQKREMPQGFRTAPAKNPPQSNSPVRMPPPSAEKDIKAQQARFKQMQPGSPTSGPKPGAGRMLNNILKPII